jgi:hypothetical protein
MLNRRQFLGLGLGAAIARQRTFRTHPRASSTGHGRALGTQPAGLPTRQHAWEDTLSRDTYGNPIPPRYNRLLLFDVRPQASEDSVHALEAGLRTLERAFPWGPQGLLFTVSWGPRYFERYTGASSPVPTAHALSTFEAPIIDQFDACLHLACDDEQRLAEIEDALVHGETLRDASGRLDLAEGLRWRETRTGFVGEGLPAAHQDVAGIPAGSPVPTDSPLFMGFKSGLVKNQASEDAVTIRHGAFAGGTTMHVSYMHLNLKLWYERNTERQRVQEMYAAQVMPAEVPAITTSSPNHADQLQEAIYDHGVVGHAQTSAQARRHGQPIILRRDFDTVDGNHAGVHFVSVQRTIADFVRTREAMNEAHAEFKNPVITNTSNNGINLYMQVLRRANYIVPSRRHRSFPLLHVTA